MTSTDLLVMLLADARLPVAGHTQSAGLEPALAGGLTAEEVPGYCRTRLATVALVEAATAVVTRSVANSLPLTSYTTGFAPKLAQIEAAWAARTPSDAMRATSRLQARGLLRLATRLWSESPPVRAVAASPQPSRAVVLGAIAAAVGLPPLQLARLIGYDDVQTVTSAALKLLPLDPADTTTWVWQLLPDIDHLAGLVEMLTEPDDIPAPSAPQIEAWAQSHARTTRRLFSA
jgi:urease accessory protein